MQGLVSSLACSRSREGRAGEPHTDPFGGREVFQVDETKESDLIV